MEARQRRSYGRHRRTSAYKRGKDGDLRETLLIQCIVSGIVLFFALTVSFLPFAPARELREGIKAALSLESSVESLSEAALGLTDKYNGVKTSIKTIFGGEAQSPIRTEDVTEPDTMPVGTFNSEPEDVRIDESILEDVNSVYEVTPEKK